jgi:uncharacterized protein YegL
MSGEPIEAVRQGFRAAISDLAGDPRVSDMTYLSVIVFESQAKQLFPLTELDSISEPSIDADGSTALDEAFRTLENAIACEVRSKGSETQKADYRPLVILMTDGEPDNDDWKPIAKRMKAAKTWYDLIVCGAGPAVKDDFLNFCRRELTESVIKLDTLQPDMLKRFFRLVSQSIKMTSVSVQQNPGGSSTSTIPPSSQMPPGFTAVP